MDISQGTKEIFSFRGSAENTDRETLPKPDLWKKLPGAHREFTQISQWYDWEREQAEGLMDAGGDHLDIPVRVEALPNAKGFQRLGTGRLVQDVGGLFPDAAGRDPRTVFPGEYHAFPPYGI